MGITSNTCKARLGGKWPAGLPGSGAHPLALVMFHMSPIKTPTWTIYNHATSLPAQLTKRRGRARKMSHGCAKKALQLKKRSNLKRQTSHIATRTPLKRIHVVARRLPQLCPRIQTSHHLPLQLVIVRLTSSFDHLTSRLVHVTCVKSRDSPTLSSHHLMKNKVRLSLKSPINRKKG